MEDGNDDDKYIHVRVTRRLKAVAKQQAGARDMSLSEYIREIIKEEHKRNPPIEPDADQPPDDPQRGDG